MRRFFIVSVVLSGVILIVVSLQYWRARSAAHDYLVRQFQSSISVYHMSTRIDFNRYEIVGQWSASIDNGPLNMSICTYIRWLGLGSIRCP